MHVIIDEIVTEVVVEGTAQGPVATGMDPQALQELILRTLREELERNERHEDGDKWK